jgi:uroporphyrinogen-III synthase
MLPLLPLLCLSAADDDDDDDIQALGKVMGSELPHVPGGSDVVLYPASVKASTDLQDSLAAAGFTVQRINTYNTVRRVVVLLVDGS